jgi:hypothetical protein
LVTFGSSQSDKMETFNNLLDKEASKRMNGGRNTYLKYIVKASNPIKRSRNFLIKNKKNRIAFRANKRRQRLEKKSWKIPYKSVALYSENSHDSNAPQRLMDELTDLFDKFKDS